MMDGRVGAIRAALDDAALLETGLISYSAKYASAFYGPFRGAVASAPKSGDRKGHQIDPANGREGIRESLADLDEGADMLMVKPAGPYLDVIARLRRQRRSRRSRRSRCPASTACSRRPPPTARSTARPRCSRA